MTGRVEIIREYSTSFPRSRHRKWSDTREDVCDKVLTVEFVDEAFMLRV